MDKKNNSLSKTFTVNDPKVFLSDEQIVQIFNKRSTANDKFINEINYLDENFFRLFFYCITQTNKTHLEYSVIVKYLYELHTFIEILSKINCSLKELLSTISNSINYEFLDKNNLLFKIGDIGDKYYIILKGQLSILATKDIKVDITEEEYLKYLLKLKHNGENELLYKTLIHNKGVYPDIYEEYYEKLQEKGCVRKKLSKRFSTQKNTKFMFNSIKRKNNLKDFVLENENITVTVNEYINKNYPTLSGYNDKKEKKTVIVYKYFHVVTLKSGDAFGEVALTSSSQKR